MNTKEVKVGEETLIIDLDKAKELGLLLRPVPALKNGDVYVAPVTPQVCFARIVSMETFGLS